MTIRTTSELLANYLKLRPQSAKSANLLRWTETLFAEYLDRPGRLDDLTDATASEWLQWIERRYPSRWTRAGHRSRLLALWRFAAKHHAIAPPAEVRPARPPEPMPRSFTLEEVRRLVASCDQLPEGTAWFAALILAAYETGLRRGDLWALRREDINPDGRLWIRQHKTSRPHAPRMTETTASRVLALPGAMPLACPWGAKKYTAHWQTLRRLAGVTSGGLQQLRRTGATYIARDYGTDAAREFLGHRTHDMVRHYVDRRIARPDIKAPPKVA